MIGGEKVAFQLKCTRSFGANESYSEDLGVSDGKREHSTERSPSVYLVCFGQNFSSGKLANSLPDLPFDQTFWVRQLLKRPIVLLKPLDTFNQANRFD